MTGLHDDARRVLRSWSPAGADQERLRQEYVAHLESHADGLRRSCFPDHITTGALIVSADASHVLLTLHAKAKAWFHMGGHCEDDDATLAAAALREAVEESGIAALELDPEPLQLDTHTVPFCGDRGTVRHLDVRFLARAPEGAEHAVSEESLDVRWWPVDNLPPTPDLHVLVEHAMARLQPTSSASI